MGPHSMGSLGTDRSAAGAERAFPGALGDASPHALAVTGPDTKADAAPVACQVACPDTKADAAPVACQVACPDTKADAGPVAGPVACPVGGRLVVMRVPLAGQPTLGGDRQFPWAHAD